MSIGPHKHLYFIEQYLSEKESFINAYEKTEGTKTQYILDEYSWSPKMTISYGLKNQLSGQASGLWIDKKLHLVAGLGYRFKDLSK